jgi:hypothetical protein
MYTITILKNGITFKTFKCEQNKVQKTFNRAFNMAGGMWDGINEYNVIIA